MLLTLGMLVFVLNIVCPQGVKTGLLYSCFILSSFCLTSVFMTLVSCMQAKTWICQDRHLCLASCQRRCHKSRLHGSFSCAYQICCHTQCSEATVLCCRPCHMLHSVQSFTSCTCQKRCRTPCLDTILLVLQTMPQDVFVQLYETPRIPVVMTGLQEDWKAKQLWNTASLYQRFADHKFKVRHSLELCCHPFRHHKFTPWHSFGCTDSPTHLCDLGCVPPITITALVAIH